MKRILTLLSTGLMLGALSTPVARSIDFDPENAGNFRGLWSISANGTALATQVNGRVTVPPSGNRMRLRISGVLTSGMQTVPMNTTITFGPGRKLRANSTLLGLAGPHGTLPSRFSGGANLRATLRARPGAMLLSSDLTGTTMRYSYKFSQRRVQIVGRGSLVQGGSTSTAIVRCTLARRGR